MAKRKAPATQGKRVSQATKDKGFKLYCEGLTFAAIGRQLGYSANTVSAWSKGHSASNPSGDKKGNWRARRIEAEAVAEPVEVVAAKPRSRKKQPEPQPVTAKGEANNVVPLDSARERKSILQNCKDIREQLRTAVERLVHDQDYRPLGSVATAFERIARLEIELDPLSPYEWVKVAVERGWDVTQLAEAVVEERKVG